jgi:ssDNA thymidine ADP-ribosyltransferase, DarT
MSRELLNPKKALIFRIVHRDNMPHILSGGCHCKSNLDAKGYVQIGNPELIERRTARAMPCAPGGTLSDYVPFYFTPYSPMLYNIKTGHNGIQKRPLTEIVILVSSLHLLKERNVPFVFSDRHAYLKTALFFSSLEELDRIGWTTLQERNFKKDDPERFEKYQAEALVYKHVPLDGLIGAACYDEASARALTARVDSVGREFKVVARPGWYF